MAITNHERVGKALDLLRTGLRPFVERELKAHHGENWTRQVKDTLTDTRLGGTKGDPMQDVPAPAQSGSLCHQRFPGEKAGLLN